MPRIRKAARRVGKVTKKKLDEHRRAKRTPDTDLRMDESLKEARKKGKRQAREDFAEDVEEATKERELERIREEFDDEIADDEEQGILSRINSAAKKAGINGPGSVDFAVDGDRDGAFDIVEGTEASMGIDDGPVDVVDGPGGSGGFDLDLDDID